MTITWPSSGSYVITERNKPDHPIRHSIMNAGESLRSDAGVLYNPIKYTYDYYSMTFSNVNPVIATTFGSIFENGYDFTIADANFGTGSFIPVPGTLAVSYLTKNNCNVTFSFESKAAR
jgi:hypothetical protein